MFMNKRKLLIVDAELNEIRSRLKLLEEAVVIPHYTGETVYIPLKDVKSYGFGGWNAPEIVNIPLKDVVQQILDESGWTLSWQKEITKKARPILEDAE